MKKSPVDHNGDRQKVVSLRFDAKFYFERAVQSLERHRYDKALKYFQFSIEKEPDNPINHCNLAGLLSELGRFEESNQILETVLEDVAPDLHECLFFIANNYAHMGFFEMAENYLLEYIDREPEGEYIEDAEEMLYLLSYELGRPPKELPVRLPEYMQKHEEARNYIEEGKFIQAVKLLKEIVETHPDFMAAYNNLSLAYFYMDQISDAVQMAEHVLEEDPNNLHALCNLAILSHHQQETETYEWLIQRLRKLIPLHQDHLYKLATTLGILGEHETAYQLFIQLLKTEVEQDACLYHYLAVAACNTGRFSKAKRYWEYAADMDQESDVPTFYLEQLDTWLSHSKPVIPAIQYYYHLPFEETLLRLQSGKQNSKWFSDLQKDPLLRSSFFWVLHRDDQTAKIQVIQLLGLIADEESERLLRHYLLRQTKDDEECKQLALLVLRQMNAKPPYTVWMDNQLVVIELSEKDQQEPSINQVWSQILERCLEGMKHYSVQQQNDVKTLWVEFIKRQGSQLPTVRRIEAWAAALEYVVAKHHGLRLTQIQVASKYEASPSTVANHVKKLNKFKKVFSK